VGIVLLALAQIVIGKNISLPFRARKGQMSFVCKWGKERIRLNLPTDPSTPLGVIREMIAQHTGLPQDRFKLIHSGAIMKDDKAPISAYHLVPNSVIAIIGSSDTDVDGSRSSSGKQASAPPTEQSTLQTIQAELDAVRTSLKPSVDAFLGTLSSKHEDDPKQTHTRLAELLLQSLLRLDAILPEGDWVDVRSARKGAVKEVQGLLDQLDEGWRQAKL